VPSVPQIGMGNCLETAMRKESGRKFVGQSLVLHESMLPSGLYRPLVQVFGVEFTPLKASYLRRDQQRAVREIVRTLLRPCLELAVMLVKQLEMPRAVLCRRRRGVRRPRERRVKVVFGGFEVKTK